LPFAPYQVNGALMAATRTAGEVHARLPACHNRETTKGEELFATHGARTFLEVTEEVLSPIDVRFDQAEKPYAHDQGPARGR
jgi:ornithine carbamoyltransferase